MRSLRMKMVMIMVILILALMLTTGAFLMSGVGNFYVSQFYEQMEETFTPEFIVQLQRLSEEDNAPAQMKALLMAQAGLGIDITGRNVYILDQTGSVLDSSNQKTSVAMTQNILSAMNGEVGQSSAITNNYMDLAVPVDAASGSYIAYIRDNRATVDALTSELLIIILRAVRAEADGRDGGFVRLERQRGDGRFDGACAHVSSTRFSTPDFSNSSMYSSMRALSSV